jgi:long-subunit acyl-CoA synthetase (AMP-forming)
MEKKYNGFRELLQARAESDLPALRCGENGAVRTMSGRELYRAVLARERSLQGDSAGRVMLLADGSAQSVVSLFARVLAGQDVVMADPGLPDGTLAMMARAAGAEDAEADEELLSLLQPCLMPKRGVRAEGEGRLVFFTSGTSERSRAAVLTSRAFCASAWNGQCMLPCHEGDVILSMLPLAHVFGFVCTLLWPLAYGACAALGRGRRQLFADCSYFHPTILPAVPALLTALLQADALNPELRTVLIGAAPCTKETIQAVRKKNISVRFGYGLTETASGLAISTDDENPFAMALCPDTRVQMAEDGEILVKTACMMEGYLGGEPMGDGWLSTGDLGYRDERGALHVTGRKKELLALPNGNKIFCPEYERELQMWLPGAETAVVLRGGKPTLLVYGGVTAEQAQNAVREYNKTLPLSGQLAGAQVLTEPLPRTATGKLKRWMLEEAT